MALAISLASCSDDGATLPDATVDVPPGDATDTPPSPDGGATDDVADVAPVEAGADVAPVGDGALVTYTEPRVPCMDRNPLRNPYYGDLHVHTANSMDAYQFGTRGTPDDAYRYARGEAVMLSGGRAVQLDRPLDFAGVTDHSEWLGEVSVCTDPGSPAFASATCAAYRTRSGSVGAVAADECGPGGADCRARQQRVWLAEQAAAEAAYDRTAACRFTSFIAYEFTGNYRGSWAHRNVIFRNAHVPAVPVSSRDVAGPPGLWASLVGQCLDAGTGCDVLAIPHNMNFSAGNEFALDYPAGATMMEQVQRAALRARVEPLVEVYQTKGSSECYDHPMFGSPDELCRTGDIVPPGAPLCGGNGAGHGAANFGCVARVDYLRGILAAGMAEDQRIGVNPYRVGVIADTDTHNGIPGGTPASNYQGNHARGDATPLQRLAGQEFRHNSGGLAAVWAVENSRDAIFDALARRETFGTSGPRLAVRFFGGWSYPDGLCADPALLPHAYADGVPMGGTLPAPPPGSGAPTFVVQALRDAVPLQRVQVIKGWVDAAGASHDRVFDVAGGANGATVDLATCVPRGAGADSLCAVWRDPTFDPAVRAFYYVRVLENPTCHWSQYDCNRLPAPMRPPVCASAARQATIQERAWSSPIWYSPAR